MRKHLFEIFISLLFVLPIAVNADSFSGTYYGYEFGNNDYYTGGDSTYTSTSKVVFDGAGNFTSESLSDSENDEDPFSGTYTVDNGVLTMQVGAESYYLRISPDGETVAHVTANKATDEDEDNEVLFFMIKESDTKENIVPVITYLLF